MLNPLFINGCGWAGTASKICKLSSSRRSFVAVATHCSTAHVIISSSPTLPSRFHLNTRCRHSHLTSEYNQPFLSPLLQLYPGPGRRRRNNYGIAWHNLQAAGVGVRSRAGERGRRSAWRLGNTAVRRVCYCQIEDNVDEEDIIKRAFSRGVVVVGCNANKINTNV